MRLLLVLVVAWGLVPGLREVAESGEGLVRDGQALVAHQPQAPADQGSGGDEHPCGVTIHLCGCCAAQPTTPSSEVRIMPPGAAVVRLPLRAGVGPAAVGLDGPFRPPIASA